MNGTDSSRTSGGVYATGLGRVLGLLCLPGLLFVTIAATVRSLAGPIPAILERFEQVTSRPATIAVSTTGHFSMSIQTGISAGPLTSPPTTRDDAGSRERRRVGSTFKVDS